MKIRDLKQYVKSLCGTDSLENLGTNEDQFLSYMYGTGQELDAAIGGAADFASHSEEQLFYEFVQNAYDANATALMFFIKKDYLVVLNNGDPFYTDKNIKQRHGQLYSFLAKGKSSKYSDSGQLGKYGQGSKLLYTLLTDKTLGSNSKQLIKVIKNERKAPYLISWHDTTQLQNLLLLKNSWSFTDPEDEVAGMLVAKILYSYYPISPGVEDSLFSFAELKDAVKAFEELVDPKRNMNRLQQGTALIIPLGEGQYESITDSENVQRVLTRLGGFSSLTSDKDYNQGKHIDHIYVFGEEVEQHSVKTITVDFTEDDEQFEYQFAFNPIFANEGYVNFFKGLPILETKYGLGFIVDSQQFDVDNSRQRITDGKKTGEQLRIAFRLLLEKVQKIKGQDKELFDYVYDSVVATNIPDGEDYDFIRLVFQEEFNAFLRANVRTTKGEYSLIEETQYTTEKLEWIPTDEIGATRSWVSNDLRRKYEKCSIKDIAKISFAELLLSAKPKQLGEWILSLDNTTYAKFHNCCLPLFADERLESLKIYRSNKGKLYSASEILDEALPILVYDNEYIGGHLRASEILEYISQPISLDSDTELLELLVEKIKANQELFATNPSSQECACAILSKAFDADVENKDDIYHIAILTNRLGDRVEFNGLLLSRPNNTCLYDSFVIQGYKPSTVMPDWCVATPDEYWEWTKLNLESIKPLTEWEENPERCLKDISTVYRGSDAAESKDAGDKIELYLDDDGLPTDEVKHRLFNGQQLTQEEYDHLREVFPDAGIIAYRFANILNRPPFHITYHKVYDLYENGVPIDNMTLSAFFKMQEDLLGDGQDGFHIAPMGDMWSIEPLQSFERNYIGLTEYESELDKKLERRGLFRIDNDLVRYIPSGKVNAYKFSTNDALAKHAIEVSSRDSILFLLPIIDKCNEEVKKYYFSQLGEINIDKQIAEDSEEWALIEYGIQHSQFRQSIFAALRSRGQKLPESINSSEVVCNEQVYSIYDLDEDVKLENETIESFLSLIPKPSEFRSKYYIGKERSIPASELYEQLHDTPLSIQQMLFCLDYSFSTEGITYDGLTLASSVKLAEMLDAISARSMRGFNRFYHIEGFHAQQHIFADKKLLNEVEYLPSPLYKWYEQNEEGDYLFENVITHQEPYIQMRQAFLEGSTYHGSYGFKVETLLSNLEWISRQTKEIVEKTSEYKIVNSLIAALPKGYEGKRYLPRYVKAISKDKDALSVYKLEEISPEYFLLYDEDRYSFSRRLLVSESLQQLVATKRVYQCDNSDIVLKYKLDNDRRWKIARIAKEDGAFSEWNHRLYKEWCSLYKIRILLSKQDVAISFAITCNGNEVFAENIKNAELGYSRDNFVVIKHPNASKQSVLKTIEFHLTTTNDQALLGWFQKPFMALQGMFLGQLEEIEKIAEDKGLEVRDFINEYTPSAPSQEDKSLSSLTTEQKKKLAENIENIEMLCDKFSGEDLEYLKDNIDRIKEMMSDEKDEQSQVRQIIGYIGELIYEHYLKEKLRVKYEFSADNRVGEYDFKYTDHDGHTVYVDVKTNLYSLKDGNSPFYLHRSQNQFMHEHPDADYRIVRVSLKDLNLAKSYSRARDIYGKEQDPRENWRLRMECKRIAKNYWRQAQIDEFTSDSPEYAIRIEKK